MGDLVITILIFVGVMGVTALLFGGWIVVSIIRFVGRAMSRQPAAPPSMMRTGDCVLCANEMCRTPNPPAAQFCRRCGRALNQSAARPAAVRRAAMW
jgi:hypothetical protein